MKKHALRRVADGWTVDGKKPETVMQGFKVLHGIFRIAIDERALLENPVQRVKPPSVKAPALIDWTPAQVQRFLAEAGGDPLHDAWLLLFATLTRIGELAALKWTDVNWDAGTITVQRTWSRDEDRHRVIVDRTKTERSTRVVPIPPSIIERLRTVRATRSFDDDGWIIATDQAPMTATRLRSAWNRAVAQTDLPRITPHGAWHSGASTMIVAGVPPTVVQRILGHTNPAFTMHRYVLHQPDDLQDAARILDGLYRGDMELSRVQDAPKVTSIDEKRRKNRQEIA